MTSMMSFSATRGHSHATAVREKRVCLCCVNTSKVEARTPTIMPSTLNDKVVVLRSQLGLAADLSLAEVVQKAAEHVGLSDDDMGNPLHSKADACMQKMGVVVPPERIAMGTDGRPIPRIFVTEMVGGHTGVDRPREGSAKPRLIEYPPIAELQAMSTDASRHHASPRSDGRRVAVSTTLKFWRNDGEESDFYGACPKLE